MKINWVERIRMRMDELEMTQEMLAGKLDITRSAVTHYLAGRRVPPLKQFHKIAKVLQTDAAWLQFGVVSIEREGQKNFESKESNLNRIPLLSYQEAAEFIRANQNYHKQFKNWLPDFYTEKENCYAVQIKNDAMTDLLGVRRSFYEGDYIIIDSEREPKQGDYVVAILPKSSEIIVRQFIIDGGVRYLKPLNAQYPIAKEEKGMVIGGTVVGVFAGFFG